MFATMSTGKLVGLGAGGAVSSLVVYRNAESTRDASTADRSRGRRRAAEKQRLAEKRKQAVSTRHDADDDAGGSSRKAPAPAATAPAVATAGTAAAAPEKPVAPERRVVAKPAAAAEETVVETEVVMRSSESDASRSARATRRVRARDDAARAAVSSSSPAIKTCPKKRNRANNENKPTRTVAPLAAVAAPFGLLVARNLFRHVMSIGGTRPSRNAKKSDDDTNEKPTRNANTAFERVRSREPPVLSLRAKAAIAAAGADADATAELDRVIGFQAKELRFMRLALAEKDARIAKLSAERAKSKRQYDDVSPEPSFIEVRDGSDVSLDDVVDLDATVDATVDEVLRELAEERRDARGERDERDARPKRIISKGVPFAARGAENVNLSERVHGDGDVAAPARRRDVLGTRNVNVDANMPRNARGSFLDPAVRVARGKSRVHRISPTRRQRETERAAVAAERWSRG